MPFKDPEFDLPDRLETDDFVLRPILASDAELDHAAVMESKDHLRVWEQSSWPEDDFTVAANRKDLEMLEQRHNARLAYTYTVLDPTGTECLGCVYLISPRARMFTDAEIDSVTGRAWHDQPMTVYFWVRRSRLSTRTDRLLLESLRSWLAEDWGVDGPLFVTHEDFSQQVALIEDADLELRFRIRESGKQGNYLAFA